MGRINRRIYATRRKKSSALKSLVVDGQVTSDRGMQNQQYSGLEGLFGKVNEIKTKRPKYMGGSDGGFTGGEDKTYTITKA